MNKPLDVLTNHRFSKPLHAGLYDDILNQLKTALKIWADDQHDF